MRYAILTLGLLCGALSFQVALADEPIDSWRLDRVPPEYMEQIKAYNEKIWKDAVDACQRSGAKACSLEDSRAVVLPTVAWNKPEVTVAFAGGSDEARSLVESIAQEWIDVVKARAADLNADPNKFVHFSFRSNGAFRTWSKTDTSRAADIRISFEGGDYNSQIGVINSAVRPNVATMNLGGIDQKIADLKSGYSRSVVLHEFGHALGFAHEQFHAECQNDLVFWPEPGFKEELEAASTPRNDACKPEKVCTQQLKISSNASVQGSNVSPGIYAYAKYAPYCWCNSLAMFQFDRTVYFAKTPDENGVIGGAKPRDSVHVDAKSVMLYSLPDFMFKSRGNSACNTRNNGLLQRFALTLSSGDKDTMVQLYGMALPRK